MSDEIKKIDEQVQQFNSQEEVLDAISKCIVQCTYCSELATVLNTSGMPVCGECT